MTNKRFCDGCGCEIPTEFEIQSMPHNKAANVKWGLFLLQSGVGLFRRDDLCETCAARVGAYIDTLRAVTNRNGKHKPDEDATYRRRGD